MDKKYIFRTFIAFVVFVGIGVILLNLSVSSATKVSQDDLIPRPLLIATAAWRIILQAYQVMIRIL